VSQWRPRLEEVWGELLPQKEPESRCPPGSEANELVDLAERINPKPKKQPGSGPDGCLRQVGWPKRLFTQSLRRRFCEDAREPAPLRIATTAGLWDVEVQEDTIATLDGWARFGRRKQNGGPTRGEISSARPPPCSLSRLRNVLQSPPRLLSKLCTGTRPDDVAQSLLDSDFKVQEAAEER